MADLMTTATAGWNFGTDSRSVSVIVEADAVEVRNLTVPAATEEASGTIEAELSIVAADVKRIWIEPNQAGTNTIPAATVELLDAEGATVDTFTFASGDLPLDWSDKSQLDSPLSGDFVSIRCTNANEFEITVLVRVQWNSEVSE